MKYDQSLKPNLANFPQIEEQGGTSLTPPSQFTFLRERTANNVTVFGWFEEVVRFGRFWKKPLKSQEPNQSRYRQDSQKVCVQQFHGWDEDQSGIFLALLVQFGLGIMPQERFCEVQILAFMRWKSSNLEGPKIWGVDVEISLYLRMYTFLGKHVYQYIVWVFQSQHSFFDFQTNLPGFQVGQRWG